MRKSFLQGIAMSDAASFVEEAAGWAKRLTKAEARGPGDMVNAWRRLEAKYGVPWRAFWALRYRKPREVSASIHHRLAMAYRAECERQLRLLQHEIEITKAKAGARHPSVVSAEAVVRKARKRRFSVIDGA
jgi:hypothetical protein